MFLISLLACLCTARTWIQDYKLRDEVLSRTVGITPPKYQLNLDLDPKDRWTDIITANKAKMKAATDYFNNFIPENLQPLVMRIGESLGKSFPDYHEEMQGIADASGIDVGEIVVLNLVYQLEQPFNNCSSWNNTGPGCNGDSKYSDMPIGLCTSIVAQESDGTIIEGRNLDFNFPPTLNRLISTIEYQRGGKTVFTGTTLLGFVGLLNAMKPNAFTFSINARNRGGNPVSNFGNLLLGFSKTPSQAARLIFESCNDYSCALKRFQKTKLVNPVYYTVGGVKPGEGAIVTRDRLMTADTLRLHDTKGKRIRNWLKGSKFKNWYKLQTNYDHWKSVPSADDRRGPGNMFMQTVGADKISVETMFNSVLYQWPVFNPHTDFTTTISASKNYYNTTVWMRDE